ncbi:nitroreductase family protein [Clostridium brassicae]|uniref:Nitroreductase family protein n=1 Tax=Clostridium brassicae TaxID=2999072 RepID=A0ABT4D4M2_9CLOT|nr:nitroreductase family protein [Clostridium brassicae]MCY6957235.1 nitroreductase family protein [Clostridium brassicae]
MSIKQCITMRRSIRKYKEDDIPDELIFDLLDCARLAPSACNSQPWRFKIVKDKKTKQTLSKISFNQKHISEAPVVLVCCANLKEYVRESLFGSDELYNLDVIDKDLYKMIKNRSNGLKKIQAEKLAVEVSFNVAMAIEHIVLRATELGIGSCWVKIADENKIKELFSWDENIKFVSMLTLGYPNEEPKSIKKLSLEEIML